MEIKKIIIISIFLLVILSIAAVSAEDNQTSDEPLTCEVVNQTSDDVLSSDEDYKKEGVNIYDSVGVDEGYYTVADAYDYNYFNGTIVATIDDEVVSNQTFSPDDEESFYSLCIQELPFIPSLGIHKVNLTYYKSQDKILTTVKNVEFKYTFNIEIGGETSDSFKRYYGDMLNVWVYLPQLSTGQLKLSINGKSYDVKIETMAGGKSRGNVKINTKDFKIGKHILEAKFTSSSKDYPSSTKKVLITILPRISYLEDVSSTEKDTIRIETPKGTNMEIAVFEYAGENKWGKQIASYSSKGGVFNIELQNLLTKTYNELYLNYTVGDLKRYEILNITVVKNTVNLKPTISKIGNSVKLTVTGPKMDGWVLIYFDGKYINDFDFKKGKISKIFSSLGVGKHKINVKFYGPEYYSNTLFVTVKANDKVSLTLKSVKIKKSAKKLVLSSTLKLNKKAKKGLKLTFKFNGKKYTAKTNKKGFAKVTIKKKVLKKLKVGKKINYQVNYSFIAVKKTAKVKK